MARLLCAVSVVFLLVGTYSETRADGMNVARFLVNNQLRVKAKPAPTQFDRAFSTLRAARGKVGQQRMLLSRTSKHQIVGVANGAKRTQMLGKRELLFDGKRAYLRMTTSSRGLRPNVTSKTVRLPLGRLFGWYGKRLLKAQFPNLNQRQMQRALAK